MHESTSAVIVDGILMYINPLLYKHAAKPARSPITPPPQVITTDLFVSDNLVKISIKFKTLLIFLFFFKLFIFLDKILHPVSFNPKTISLIIFFEIFSSYKKIIFLSLFNSLSFFSKVPIILFV